MMESQIPIQKSRNDSECCQSRTNAAITATTAAIAIPGPVSRNPALRAFRPPRTPLKAPFSLPRLPTSTPMTAAEPKPMKDAFSKSAASEPSSNQAMTSLTASVAVPSPAVIPARKPGAAWKIGMSKASPKRPAAAPTFWKEERTVEPIASAPPPTIVSIASAKSSKPTSPAEIIFCISPVDTPYCSDRTGNRPSCLSSSWASSSP